jgi:hypothetical protein
METGVIQFLEIEISNFANQSFYNVQILVGGNFTQLKDVYVADLVSKSVTIIHVPIRYNEHTTGQAVPGTLEIFYKNNDGFDEVWHGTFFVQVEHRLYFESHKAVKKIKVFICHSAEDKIMVRDFCKRLRADGIDYWLDEENILPGQDWKHEIQEAIYKSHAVIVCLTRNSINKIGYVQKEIKFAIDIADEHPEGSIFIIPVRFEECAVPVRLNRWQWVNYYDEDGYSKLQKSFDVLAKNLLSS